MFDRDRTDQATLQIYDGDIGIMIFYYQQGRSLGTFVSGYFDRRSTFQDTELGFRSSSDQGFERHLARQVPFPVNQINVIVFFKLSISQQRESRPGILGFRHNRDYFR